MIPHTIGEPRGQEMHSLQASVTRGAVASPEQSDQGDAALATRGLADAAKVFSGSWRSIGKDVTAAHLLQLRRAQRLLS